MEILEIKEKLQKVLMNSKFGVYEVNMEVEDDGEQYIDTILELQVPSGLYANLFISINAKRCTNFNNYLKWFQKEVVAKNLNSDVNKLVYNLILDRYKEDEIPDYASALSDAIYYVDSLKYLLRDISLSIKGDIEND